MMELQTVLQVAGRGLQDVECCITGLLDLRGETVGKSGASIRSGEPGAPK